MKIKNEKKCINHLSKIKLENIFEPRENKEWVNSTALSVKYNEKSMLQKHPLSCKENLHLIRKNIKMKRVGNPKLPNVNLKNFTLKSIKSLGNFFKQSVIKL